MKSTARSIMVDSFVTIDPSCTVDDAIHVIVETDVQAAFIVDDAGLLVGVVTEFALLAALYDDAVRSEPVVNHATKSVISVDGDTPLTRVADLLILHRIRVVPVIENGRIAGVISRRTLLSALERSSARRAPANQMNPAPSDLTPISA